MKNNEILEGLNRLLNGFVNESETKDESDKEYDVRYSTEKQGVMNAVDQVMQAVMSLEMSKKKGDDGDDGDGPDYPEDDKKRPKLSVDDDPHSGILSGGKDGDENDENTFKSSDFEEFDDELEKLELESDEPGAADDESEYDVDDFDYDDKGDGSGSGPGSDGETKEGSDDFGDGLDDSEEDYDFGDDGDDSGDVDGGDGGDDGNIIDDFGTGGGSTGRGGHTRGGKSKKGGGDSKVSGSGGHGGTGAGGGSVDYDDTIDYDSNDYDSIEDEVKDALERISENEKTRSGKKMVDDIIDGFGKDKDGDKNIDDIIESIEDATSEKTGAGELPGENLDKTPDDKDFSEDMKKAGFSEEDIREMVKAKETDTSEKIDDEKVAKEAAKELDEKARREGRPGSSLARTIMKSVLAQKITNMEWNEMVKIFLESKAKKSGYWGTSKTGAWGDKKHLWRDAILPKTVKSGGDIDKIACFIDFSGSVSEPLVKTFLKRVIDVCLKLPFGDILVYGFGDKLSKPYTLNKKKIGKSENEIENALNDMWDFISKQYIGGSIENFEVVAEEINKLKRKDYELPVFIFGDGLWSLAYPNPKPPMYLKVMCQRYLKDMLALVYYEDGYEKYFDYTIGAEVKYLKDVVGIENVITTTVKKLTGGTD